MGDQLLHAVDGGIGDLDVAGEAGVDEGAEDGVGVGEGELDGPVEERAREGDVGLGGGVRGAGVAVAAGGGGGEGFGGRGELLEEGLALVGELGVLAPGGVLDDPLEGRRDHQGQAGEGIGFRRSHPPLRVDPAAGSRIPRDRLGGRRTAAAAAARWRSAWREMSWKCDSKKKKKKGVSFARSRFRSGFGFFYRGVPRSGP